MNKVILLNKRPVGKPTLDDFKFIEEESPITIEEEESPLISPENPIEPEHKKKIKEKLFFLNP